MSLLEALLLIKESLHECKRILFINNIEKIKSIICINGIVLYKTHFRLCKMLR